LDFNSNNRTSSKSRPVQKKHTGSNPSVTDYILEELAKCPNCRQEILEKTLVEAEFSSGSR
jgi:hypothetical protein